MTHVEGLVERISEKDWNQIKLYSFKLEGSERWYRLGRVKPPFHNGDEVEFDERNTNVLVDSLKVSPSTSAGSVAATETSAASTSTVRETPVTNDVGARMRYQAARRDATNLVVAALQTDALPWTKTEYNKKSARLDLLQGYIEQVTKTLLEQEETNATQ